MSAIGHARASGWYLKKFSAHSWGKVQCSPDGAVDSPCALIIFSTGEGSENVAKQLHKMVDRCNHRPGPPVEPTAHQRALAAAHRHADNAEHLMDAAQRCRDADLLDDRVQELWALALEQIERGEDEARIIELDEAGQVESERAELLREARALADQGDVQGEVSESALLAAADEAVARGSRNLRRARSGHRDTRAIRLRLDRLRDRITSMRDA